jgi:hypothetical protein
MTKRRAVGVVALAVLVTIALGASAHAMAGSAPHEAGECIACALCDWVNALLT